MRRPLARSLALQGLQGPVNDLVRRARARPSLDLRFAETKSLTDWISGQNLVTFTRASSATFTDASGTLQTATTDAPVFDHNPLTGASLGLRVEESRTNLLTYSEEFDNGAAWNLTNILAFGSGSTANAIASPDGLVTADKVTEDLATGFHRIGQQFSHVAGTTYTFTVFVKAAERTKIHLQLSANLFKVALFDLTTGTTANPDASIVNYGDGWYRCSLTNTATTTSTASVFVEITDDSSNRQYTGDGTSGIYLWGAQLEAGAFPTSYIPTTTATATRSADLASITGANFSSWYRQDEGTVFAEGSAVQPVTAGNQFFFRTSDNGYSNSIALNIQSTGFPSLATSAAGVFDGNASSIVSLPANTAAKFIGAYAANNLGVSLNGARVATDLSATIPTTLNRLDIGSDHLGFNRIRSGIIRRLTYWPQRLPNNTLIALTR